VFESLRKSQPQSPVIEIALSNCPNRLGISLPSPEAGNRSSLRNVVFSSYLEFRTINEVEKPNDSECYELEVSNLKTKSLANKLKKVEKLGMPSCNV
jgi:hypothetical protein